MGRDDASVMEIDELVDRVDRQHQQLHQIVDKLGQLYEEIKREIGGRPDDRRHGRRVSGGE